MENTQKGQNNDNITLLTLQEMFRVVGDQLNARDVRVLKFMFSDIFPSEFLIQIRDGFSFLATLERINKVDESNFKNIENYLRLISRHDLFQFLTLRRRETVRLDPVNEYIEKRASKILAGVPRCLDCKKPLSDTKPSTSATPPSSKRCSTHDCHSRSSKKHCVNGPIPMTGILSPDNPSVDDRRTITRVPNPSHHTRRRSEPSRRSDRLKRRSNITQHVGTIVDVPAPVEALIDATDDGRPEMTFDPSTGTMTASLVDNDGIRQKLTCDIRLRVRAEYTNHTAALQGYVQSNKPELIERQFEKFMQANTILKSRDLGSIICDIKFSELTYLDAFWRDYINGSLLEALRGVFITEPLKQAVNHEEIKLVVNIDEDDYEAGRLKLLKNLQYSDGYIDDVPKEKDNVYLS